MHSNVSKLCIGTAHFGQKYGLLNEFGSTEQHEVNEILRLALSSNITTLDTAVSYGNSENLLGNFQNNSFQIISKIPHAPDIKNINDWVDIEINAILSRLKTTSIYGILLHKPLQLLEKNGPELFQALERYKELGIIKKIGISIYEMEELEVLTPLFSFDIVQSPLNIFDQRLIKSGWLDKLKKLSIEIHTRSTFLQGLLLLPASKVPIQFDAWNSHFKKWQEWLLQNNYDSLDVCLQYPLQYNQVDKVIVGVENSSQLRALILAANNKISRSMPDFSIDDKDLILPTRWSK